MDRTPEDTLPTHPVAGSPLLSLAMIVRNGGQFLACLLQEAAPWVDEIVVGDTGSTDDTPGLAGQAGARVLEVPWRDDFAAARNHVLGACRGRWVLILDADERLARPDWQALRAWVQAHRDDPAAPAVRLSTRNYLPGRHERRGWQPVPQPDPHALPGDWPPAPGFVATAKVRLFRPQGEVAFRGRLHETVEASLTAAAVAVVELPLPVHHFGLLEHRPGREAYYLELARRKAAEQPDDAQAWAELADAAVAAQAQPEALAAIDRALFLAPDHGDRRLTAGWLLLQAGRLEQADAQLAAVATGSRCDDIRLAEACHLRAQIAMRQQRTEAAGRLLAVALHLFPDNGHYLNTLGAWHLTRGLAPEAEAALRRACRLLPGHAQPWLNLGRMCAAAGQPQLAADHFRQALQRDPRCEAALAALADVQADQRA